MNNLLYKFIPKEVKINVRVTFYNIQLYEQISDQI